ncbi:hypothetical protein [Marinobacter sp.]|jgi:hypothetical protein|uniref:hypothetical protein n=1 Tax=Marinobacter sp. TaxID=50741 RepID=UPI0023580082|nr:hypothetical protein [Marinobacter sp.]|tara:strand:- start:1116 stop:1334 length:219 start_codon:yes stop_codon:yes gene_type:complete
MKIIIDNKQVDLNSITIEDVHNWDYPEFCDAFVSFAKFIDGTELNDNQLNIITDKYPEFVNDLALQTFQFNL